MGKYGYIGSLTGGTQVLITIVTTILQVRVVVSLSLFGHKYGIS